jgi:DNA-binding CsgD family transcriptional regulator
MPVVGAARDVFGMAVALAVLTVWEKPDVPPAGLVASLREAFDLTTAEARVAALIGLGVTLADAARILTITVGTARNYLKAAQQKTGLSRQAELAAIVALMQA